MLPAEGTEGEVSIKQARGMQAPQQRPPRVSPPLARGARVTVEDLRSDRGLPTEVRFDGEAVASLLSRQRIAVAMQMLRPGQSVVLNEEELADGPEGCKWSLSCSPRDELSVSCTRALGDAAPIHGVSAAFHGCGMTVRCGIQGLHPDTLKALEYMNAQVLPRAEACRRAVELMKTRALPPRGAEKKKRLSAGWSEVDGAGVPSIFTANNRGVISRTADLVNANAPRGCDATYTSIRRRLYLASLLCATAPQTEQPFLIVDTASKAIPMPPDVAEALYKTPVLRTHVSVLVKGPAGPQRVNCYTRQIRSSSAGGEHLRALLGTLGIDVVGDVLLITGPRSNSFGAVFRSTKCVKVMKAEDEIVIGEFYHVHDDPSQSIVLQ